MTDLEGKLHQIAREARIAANCSVPGWSYSVTVPVGFFISEGHQALPVRSYASRAKIPRELVRIDWNLSDVKADTTALNHLLSMEIEPFIIGVGKVRSIQTTESLVILRADEG